MKLIHSIAEFRDYRASVGRTRTPFVPTMGALHEGHVSLVRQARQMAEEGAVLASIFVNPTQFGPNEDFSKYPRTLEGDCEMLKEAGCDAVFVPSALEMYPGMNAMSTQGLAEATSVDPGPLANILEGAIRPGHFRGVCTVVAKLLNIVQPSHMLLGQKDFQQQMILRLMCRDLNMGVEVVTCLTVREADGLAMSSRNRYLSEGARQRASVIHEALAAARTAYRQGQVQPERLEEMLRQLIADDGLEVQYATVRCADTLQPFATEVDGPAVLLVAAKLETTRLIDNMLL